MNRIYHPYTLWEDHKAGFYDNCSGQEKEKKALLVKEMFNSEELTTEYMRNVINEWKYSCEHNLTNESLNKIAYLGQGACCIYGGVPSTVTMETWSELPEHVRERADKIAAKVLKEWEENNKYIQLCLKLD